MVKIGKVVWPGLVGIGAGIIKGTAAFLDFGTKADSIEIGSITRHLREGNSGQTVWKYPEEQTLRHNAGLPNPGAEGIVNQLKDAQLKIQIPWGLNLAVSPGIADTQQALADVVDAAMICLGGGLRPNWLTLNVSSPDTQDTVTMLSEPTRVWTLINGLKAYFDKSTLNIPLWVKIGPSLPLSFYSALGDVFVKSHVDAIVVSNTMPDPKGAPGGWCGRSMRAVARSVVWEMRQVTKGVIPIVAAGGVIDGEQVRNRLEVGASAVQVVSAILFRGRDAAQVIRKEYEILEAKRAVQKV